MLKCYLNAKEIFLPSENSYTYEFMVVLMSFSELGSGYFQYIHCSIHLSPAWSRASHLSNGNVMMEICSGPGDGEKN